MTEPDDAELRALIEGYLPADRVRDLEEAIGKSTELQNRLEHLSGAANFGNDFAVDRDQSSDPGERWTEWLQESAQPDSMGRLGDYEVLSVIACGGMGVVFEGLDPGLQRTVAIKMMLPAFVANEEARERFYREATAAAAVEHENVLPIYAVDKTSGLLPFFVMRFVDGESLGTRLRREGPLPVEEAVRIGRAIASGLAAAHARDCVHRDIKPSNILLQGTAAGLEDDTEAGGVWITDFGLVQMTQDVDLTVSGSFLGTPQYCSPEQGEGMKVDHRSDLFSFGAVLYAMLAGKAPFKGKTHASLIYQIVTSPHRPLKDLDPAVPSWLSSIVDTLLHKDPDDRPSNADEVVKALDRHMALKVRSNRGIARRRLLVATAAAAAAAGAYTVYRVFTGAAGWDEGEVLSISEMGSRGARTLASALSRDRGPSEVELDFDGEMKVPPLELASRPIWIRAATGRVPVLRSSDSKLPLLTARHHLILEGLSLQAPAQGDTSNRPLIDAAGGLLGLCHCRLQRLTDLPPDNHAVAPLLRTQGVKTVDIRNTSFYAPQWQLIYLDLGAETLDFQFRIGQSLLYGGAAMIIDSSTPDAMATMDLDTNILVADSAINFFHGTSPTFPIDFSVAGNVFASERMMNLQKPLPVVRSMVTWKEQGNCYSIRDAFALTTTRRGSMRIENLFDWNRQWSNEDSETGATEVELAFDASKSPTSDDPNQPTPEDFQQIVEASGTKIDLSLIGTRGSSKGEQGDSGYLDWKTRCEKEFRS